jgi:hypothetical protein
MEHLLPQRSKTDFQMARGHRLRHAYVESSIGGTPAST